MKKSLLILLLSLLGCATLHAYDAEIDGIYYMLYPSSQTASVTFQSRSNSYPYYYSDYSGSVVIPESVTYGGKTYSVTSIGKGAFNYCEDITSVSIPNSVTSIGERAFYNCTGLTSLVIPNSVTELGLLTFCNCGFTSVDIGTGLGIIPEGAFESCCLTSINLSNVGSIGISAFKNCSYLTSISFGKNISRIDSYAFHDCFQIADIYCISETPPEVAEYAIPTSYNTTLHVPIRSVNLYKSISPWRHFNVVALEEYLLTYVVDENVYKTYSLNEGEAILPESEPTKEGYTFSGWSEIPQTMPAHDVTVTGSFIPNDYSLAYNVDGNVYKTYTVAYGSSITPEPAPIKDGYSFSGWSEIPETMPAHDVIVTGSFTINNYNLTYILDGNVYKTSTIVYGDTITPEPNPIKEGYTFSGWSEIPATMPGRDVTVTGSFLYSLTYIVDGNIYKTYTIGGGTPITPEPAPTKEGYTFSGWTYIPPTMPATDVVIMGTFTINKYTLTYKVDGEVYKSYTVEYGSAITPEPEPTKEGYTFSGWSEMPDTMPANDVTVTGTFTKDILGTCATPTISYANGKLTYKCETEDAVCQSTITDTDIASYSGNEVDLSVTYTITVYATKEGYEDSEVATATLCWIDKEPWKEGMTEEHATEIKALPVLIQAQAGFITLQGLEAGTEVSAYNTSGMLLDTIISSQDTATLRTKLPAGSTAIVKIGQRAVKVMVK